MATDTYQARDIKGLTPAIDPTVTNDLFVLNGKNFIFDTLGPRSAFGNRLLLPQRREKVAHIQGFRLKFRAGDRSFTIDGDGIFEWDESLGGWNVIYLTPDTTVTPYRWTCGYLNGYMYFAHPVVGILCYHLNSRICRQASEIGIAVPDEVLAIAVNNGRLCVLGPTFFSWSAPSDGLDFEPKLGGAGFQQISDFVPGDPIMVSSYTKGCFVWTTGGVMRSEFTGDAAVYRHRALNTDYRPINSFCTCRVDDDTVVFLDERGLFQSRGEVPTPYAPLFNEFLLPYIQNNNLKVGQNLRLEWDELQRLLYVSVSLSGVDPIYESAFVLYASLDKWGQFNEPHYGIFPLLIKNSQRADDYYGFADSNKQIRYWKKTGSRELNPQVQASTALANLVYPAIQKPAQKALGGEWTMMSSTGKANTIPVSGAGTLAGYYLPGSLIQINSTLTGLDARIQFGFFRLPNQQASDELSEIVNVVVRSVASGEESQVQIDFNLTPPATEDEDYNVVSGSEDYGFETLNYVNHELKLVGSLDGVTEFMSASPTLVGFVKGGRYYSCSNVGLWHIMQISAESIGQAFHVRTFEITAIPAGRLL